MRKHDRRCAAAPTANPEVAEKVKEIGIREAVQTIPLLGDSSGEAGWRAWHEAVGLPYEPSRTSLTLPDSNSRVQAVIDGQGLALWDRLITPELEGGTLATVSDNWLQEAGYYLVFPQTPLNDSAQSFLEWIRIEAQS